MIRRRQQVYAEQTAPLASEYDLRDMLVSVNGNGRVDHVTDRVHTAIAQLTGVRRRPRPRAEASSSVSTGTSRS